MSSELIFSLMIIFKN